MISDDVVKYLVMPTTKKDDKDKKSKKQEKVSNEGDLAEGILGAAMVAKLVLRQPNGMIGKVTPTDVRNILKLMQKAPISNKGVMKSQVKLDVGGAAKDKITFFLNLGKVMMQELRDLKDLRFLDRISEAASSYVNSSRMEGLAHSMYNNNINNKLEIDVDGISNNKGTKADVVVRTDKYVFDKISLKAGKRKSGHSLGQVGGNSWSSILRLFHEGVNERTKKKETGLMLQINTPTNEDRYMKILTENPTFATVNSGVQFAYKLADDLFNAGSREQTSINVFKFLRHHSSRGDTDIKIVMFHLGKHKTLNPLMLEQKLKEVKLKAIVRVDTKWPVFLVYDADDSSSPLTVDSKNVIFGIRPRMDARSEGYVSHLVESGPRFSTMIEEK